jgi:hypothetical protein
MLNIAAFTFTYDQLEDRILLVGNHSNGQQRVDFWLTRKLVLRLLAAAGGLIEKTSGDIAEAPQQHRADLAQFHHDNAQQNLQVERENQQVVASNSDLLCRLDISHQDNRYRMLFFTGGDEPVAISILTYDELHQILHLIHRGAMTLEWGADAQLFGADSLNSSTLLQ